MKAYIEVAREAGAHSEFLFDADGRATRFVMFDFYCPEPECIGTEIHVDLVAAEDPSRRISFDLGQEDFRPSWEGDVPEPDRAIVDEFVSCDAVVRMLQRHRQVVRAWGLSRWKGGPPVSWEDRCYLFSDFDLNGEEYAMPFESGGRQLVAIDQHCINPDCPCDDVLLSFYFQGKRKSGRIPESFSARVDVASGRAKDAVTERPLAASQQRQLEDLQREVGPWRDELRLRRRLIRACAAGRVRAEARSAVTRRSAGRNDPCPCGSGRKFKKCCG